jgi:hypothetical protein
MAEREEETAGSLSEVTKLALALFGGKVVPFWKMKNAPNWDDFIGSWPPGNKEHSKEHKLRIKEARDRKWWKDHARKLLADHRSKKNALETAEFATRLSNPELNVELKARIKGLK